MSATENKLNHTYEHFKLPNWGYVDHANEISNYLYGDSGISGEPGWFYFRIFFDFDDEYGLLGSIMSQDNTNNENKIYFENTAYNYLTIREKRYKGSKLGFRKAALYKFVTTLSLINSRFPWFFKSVSGLDVAHQQVDTITEKKLDITFGPDSIDMTLTKLFQMYYFACYDDINMREIIPQNLRKFNMSIILYHVPLRYYNTRCFSLPAKTIQDSHYTKRTNVLSYKLYSFKGCEFDFNHLGGITPGTVSSEDPFNLGNNTFSIKYDRVYTQLSNEWDVVMLGSDGIIYDRELNINCNATDNKELIKRLNALRNAGKMDIIADVLGQISRFYFTLPGYSLGNVHILDDKKVTEDKLREENKPKIYLPNLFNIDVHYFMHLALRSLTNPNVYSTIKYKDATGTEITKNSYGLGLGTIGSIGTSRFANYNSYYPNFVGTIGSIGVSHINSLNAQQTYYLHSYFQDIGYSANFNSSVPFIGSIGISKNRYSHTTIGYNYISKIGSIGNSGIADISYYNNYVNSIGSINGTINKEYLSECSNYVSSIGSINGSKLSISKIIDLQSVSGSIGSIGNSGIAGLTYYNNYVSNIGLLGVLPKDIYNNYINNSAISDISATHIYSQLLANNYLNNYLVNSFKQNPIDKYKNYAEDLLTTRFQTLEKLTSEEDKQDNIKNLFTIYNNKKLDIFNNITTQIKNINYAELLISTKYNINRVYLSTKTKTHNAESLLSDYIQKLTDFRNNTTYNTSYTVENLLTLQNSKRLSLINSSDLDRGYTYAPSPDDLLVNNESRRSYYRTVLDNIGKFSGTTNATSLIGYQDSAMTYFRRNIYAYISDSIIESKLTENESDRLGYVMRNGSRSQQGKYLDAKSTGNRRDYTYFTTNFSTFYNFNPDITESNPFKKALDNTINVFKTAWSNLVVSWEQYFKF